MHSGSRQTSVHWGGEELWKGINMASRWSGRRNWPSLRLGVLTHEMGRIIKARPSWATAEE